MDPNSGSCNEQVISDSKTINIIKILEFGDSSMNQSVSDKFDDVYTLISKIAFCFKYIKADDIYNVVRKELKNTNLADIKGIFKKYDLPDNFFEGENVTHPKKDEIVADYEKVCLHNGHSLRDMDINWNKSIYPYNEEEFEEILRVTNMDGINPLVFIRKSKSRSTIMFVMVNNKKRRETCMEINLAFDISDNKMYNQQTNFSMVMMNSLNKLEYQKLVRKEVPDTVNMPWILGSIIGIMFLVYFFFFYYML